MERFQKSSSDMLRKMKDLEEFCDVTLVSDDGNRIRAHKVVLASASTIFRDMFQNDDDNTEYEVIHVRGVKSKLIAAMVDLVYNGETTLKEKDCNDFLKTLKEYKIVKVKSTEETIKTRCNFFNRGFCRSGSECLFNHPKEDCKTHVERKICTERKCKKKTQIAM
jgi:hypothetical protein